ncbi:MAG: ATP-dependent DNA helicase RecG [Clostridia bacterium]|nr:ATP-dependent DNA helicase RecG [Clostridia bacterium]
MLNYDITKIYGIKKERAAKFNKMGIYTVNDLINFFPRAYEDRSRIKSIIELADGEKALVRATVSSAISYHSIRKNLNYIKFTAVDNSGKINITFFNQAYLRSKIKQGESYLFFGKVKRGYGKVEMTNPVMEVEMNRTGGIMPIYPLTKGLTQNIFNTTVKNALQSVELQLEETLPEYLKNKHKLCDVLFAYQNIHFPSDYNSVNIAKKRLVFEELLYFQLGLMYLKKSHISSAGIKISDFSIIKEFVKLLPYELTSAQKRVTNDILRDMKSGKQLNRLVQGDVGSGKTIVACMAMLVCAANGYQAIMMAPTEILAVQHYEEISEYFSHFNIKTALLTGTTSKKERDIILEGTENGSISVLIGTHAVIEERVKMKNLALCITDEQHRFGVNQRNSLLSKGTAPHVLVMTATPIPRTLALILYTDLDLSVIDELPPGRQVVDTMVYSDKMRSEIDERLLEELKQGNQIYVVCPLVEESENIDPDVKNATEYSEVLQKKFPDYKVELLHGKMKPAEKEEVMMRFKKHETDIIVSTTVIEVGVNVPSATVMLVENAERFGLSQLHQLRGRVGRGSKKSYAFLVTDNKSKNTSERMKTMASTSDGFIISKKDLELRGPGDFFGTEQSGFVDMKIANLLTDIKSLEAANMEAKEILADDPELTKEKNKLIKKGVINKFKTNGIEVFN